MNNETKIKLIKKSIEDKTGESCAIYEHFGGYVINWINKGRRCTDQINYDILDLLPISDPLEEQPTCPCTILDEPCAPHCTCKEPFSSRGCYLCAQYGSEEQRKAKAKWIKERVMSTVLEEQPDKGWIPVKVRKPQEREKVMIHVSENNSVLIAYLDERKKWRLSWDSTTINLDVTHWQPLPNPPQAPVKQG